MSNAGENPVSRSRRSSGSSSSSWDNLSDVSTTPQFDGSLSYTGNGAAMSDLESIEDDDYDVSMRAVHSLSEPDQEKCFDCMKLAKASDGEFENIRCFQCTLIQREQDLKERSLRNRPNNLMNAEVDNKPAVAHNVMARTTTGFDNSMTQAQGVDTVQNNPTKPASFVINQNPPTYLPPLTRTEKRERGVDYVGLIYEALENAPERQLPPFKILRAIEDKYNLDLVVNYKETKASFEKDLIHHLLNHKGFQPAPGKAFEWTIVDGESIEKYKQSYYANPDEYNKNFRSHLDDSKEVRDQSPPRCDKCGSCQLDRRWIGDEDEDVLCDDCGLDYILQHPECTEEKRQLILEIKAMKL